MRCLLIALALISATAFAQAPSTPPADCDEQCLRAWVQKRLEDGGIRCPDADCWKQYVDTMLPDILRARAEQRTREEAEKQAREIIMQETP